MFKKTILLLLISILSIFIAEPAQAEPLNLVAYWKLDETVGDTAADSSGNENSGELVGGVIWAPEAGRFDGAALFNGRKNCRIQIPTSQMEHTSATISLWAYLLEPQKLPNPQKNNYRFLLCNTRRVKKSRVDSGKIQPRKRIQFYMDKDDTWLDLGLGKKHWKHQKIKNLSTCNWYNIVLTLDHGNYAVYIDGIRKAAGTCPGLDDFPDFMDIGNNGEIRQQAFHGLIDDVAMFDRPLTQDEIANLYCSGVESLIKEQKQQFTLEDVREAEEILRKNGPQEGMDYLERKIAEYEKWKKQNLNNIDFRSQAVLFELYFLLSRVKEAVVGPTQDVVATYKQAALRLAPARENSFHVLLWLLKHLPTEEYKNFIKTILKNSSFPGFIFADISNRFESKGNWQDFKLFLDTVVTEVENKVEFAKSIEHGLSEESPWRGKCLEYCRNKPELIDYAFEKDCEAAETHMAEENFAEAIKNYSDVMKLYDSKPYKAKLELKICQCILNGGQYQDAISELENFITKNKTASDEQIKQAIIMKGQCYIQLGLADKALNEFLKLKNKFKDIQQGPGVDYFIGYSYLLLDNFKQAEEAFRLVLNNYPKSSYASKVRLYHKEIGTMTD